VAETGLAGAGLEIEGLLESISESMRGESSRADEFGAFVGMARRAVPGLRMRDATLRFGERVWGFIPSATTRAETSQRDVPTTKHTRRAEGWGQIETGDFRSAAFQAAAVPNLGKRRNAFRPIRLRTRCGLEGRAPFLGHGTCGVTTRYHRYAFEPAAGSDI